MEAVKGLVYGPREKVKTPDNKIAHKYLVSVVLITDEPLTGLSPNGGTVIMGGNAFDNALTTALESMTKYEPPYPLGEAGLAIIQISTMNPNDLEKVK